MADQLKALAKKMPGLEIHMVGHSAGSILLAPLVGLLTDGGADPWKPARCGRRRSRWPCTARRTFPPCSGRRAQLAVYTLSDKPERGDNCAQIYNKSLLYLVPDAFEEKSRIPVIREGEPILGMERWIDADLRKTFQSLGAELVLAPNNAPAESQSASDAMHHGDFDNDEKTVASTFRRIIAGAKVPAGAARGARAGSSPSMPKPEAAEREGADPCSGAPSRHCATSARRSTRRPCASQSGHAGAETRAGLSSQAR